MTNKCFAFQEIPYLPPIETINDVKFTPREIDILACILGRRTAKKIALFLHISPKTVENHTRNIMQKLGCNSRENIIDFIETTKEAILLKQRYTQILYQAAFAQSLKEISIQMKKNPTCCTIIVDASGEENPPLYIDYLQENLKNAGVETNIETESDLKTLAAIRKRMDTYPSSLLLCILPKSLREEVQLSPEFNQGLQKEEKDSKLTFVWIFNKENKANVIKECPIKSPETSEDLISYYYLFFEILKCLFPTLNMDEVFSKLKNQCTIGVSTPEPDFPASPSTVTSQKKSYPSFLSLSIITPILKKWKMPIIISLLAIVCFSAGFISFRNENEEGFVHSDLILPAKYTFLERPELINEMNEKLKGQEGIQSIALVGLTGSGKKVLARHYARQQCPEIAWEINSEKKETVLSSFERLAYELSKADEDKQILKAIQDIKIPQEREDKVILFVRERIKNHPNWILIYYNVDDFSDIEKHIPQDFGWGSGKVIITTTDNNIRNNKYVNQVVQVGELTEKQRLDLFVKILKKSSSTHLTAFQTKEIQGFLNQIPPFPLDVSIAAFYIKETKTPYHMYIEYLKAHDAEFNKLQQNVLKETGEHEKTRYSIISLSLKNLIKLHVDYKDLLLHLSLIGSKYIPRELLYTYKDKLVVDNFLHDLNGHSLTILTLHDLDQSIPSFSIHRSVQENILGYLKENPKLYNNQPPVQAIRQAMDDYTTEIINKEDLPRMQLILDHCLRFMHQGQFVTDAMKGNIALKVGKIYYHIGNFPQAEKFLEGSLSKLYELPERNYLTIASVLAHLGSVYRELGKYELAKDSFEKSLELYKKYHSNESSDLAFSLRHLARVYRNLGNYEKARSLIEESLQLYKGKFATNHIQVARSQAVLGKIYINLAKYREAKKLLNKSYAVYVKHYGDSHPRIARLLRDLGQAHYLEGDISKGEEFMQMALKILGKIGHPELYTVFESLAELYWKKFEDFSSAQSSKQAMDFKIKAQTHLQQALEIVQKYFPADSAHILRIQSKIAKFEG